MREEELVKARIILTLIALALVLAGCAPTALPPAPTAAPAAHAAEAPAAAAPTAAPTVAPAEAPTAEPGVNADGSLTWSATAEEQIANAMSAAPIAIAQDATIMGNPPNKDSTETPVLRKGTNEWTCWPDWPAAPGNTANCNNKEFEAWNAAFMAGKKPEVKGIAMGIMLQGGMDASATDPTLMEPPPGQDWVVTPAHIHIAVPFDLDPKDFSTDPKSGQPYIMWEGTPYEHLMVPIVPAKASEMGDASTLLMNAMAAGPLGVSKEATVLDFPPQGETSPVELRKGTNNWTCWTDWPVSPGNDPQCNDPTFSAWNDAYAAGKAPDVKNIGIGYMLAGGSDPSATDPALMAPQPGDNWIVTPSHVMIVLPGGFDAGQFPHDYASGYPYIMWDGTPYEHLMVPVADRGEGAGLTPAEQRRIARVESIASNLNKNGLLDGVVLISRDGQVLSSKGYGLADREKQIPNTPQTIFRIGEMSMQMTAAAILLLEQDGKLSVDDPICKYLDDCPDAWQPVKVGNLLSHTSGIPDYIDSAEGRKLLEQGATRDQIVALFRDKPLEFEPGTQRVYNHAGFVLAGEIIENVSGQSYGDFVAERIFKPLGMVNSGYGELPEGAALGYQSSYGKTPLEEQVTAVDASGGIYSTAEDLFRWNEGLYGGKLLNAVELEKMLTAYGKLEDGTGSGYGINVWDTAGHRGAGNAGGIDGHMAMLYRYLDDGITSIVLTNHNIDWDTFFSVTDMIGRTMIDAK
jgi:CubicO group peptidase (beta-lactamase class C family)